MRKFLVLVIVLASFTLLVPAAASASTPSLKSLAKTVAALQKQVKSQATTIKSLQSQLTTAKSVLALAPYVSVTQSTLNDVVGPNIIFSGCNVHVRSASSEDETSGLGNLIVGWDNPPATTSTGYRSGSNNLICGDQSSFWSYGCFLAGSANETDNPFACVSGGTGNRAVGTYSSVSGGAANAAENQASSVSGGESNEAVGPDSSIAGGGGNVTASSGIASCVCGGENISEGFDYGWAAGGKTGTPVYEAH